MTSLRSQRGPVLFAAVAVIVAAVANLSVPFFAVTPGATRDVAGLIAIDGAQTQPVRGELRLTTVSLHEVRVAEAIWSWFDADDELWSRTAIVPRGETEREVERRTSQQMTDSQGNAAAAALSFLGYDVDVTSYEVRIDAVASDAPAARELRRGDVVVSADDVTVTEPDDLIGVVRTHAVGETVDLVLRRGGRTIHVRAPTRGRPENPAEPIIGVHLESVPKLELPVHIDIESLGIGGPSAGLVYALGIVDLLDDRDVAGGRVVAGTGEISADGAVGPVGGLRQKLAGAREAGADLFLVPRGELDVACALRKDLRVIGVESLAEAVRVLTDQAFASERTC